MRESFTRRLILWGCSTRVVMLLAVVVVILYLAITLMSINILPNTRMMPMVTFGTIPSQTPTPIPATVIVTAIVNPFLPPTPSPTFIPPLSKVPPMTFATRTPSP